MLGLTLCGLFSSYGGETGGTSLVVVPGLLTQVASLFMEQGAQASAVAAHRLSGYDSQALGHKLSSCCTGLGALQHVGSSQTGD